MKLPRLPVVAFLLIWTLVAGWTREPSRDPTKRPSRNPTLHPTRRPTSSPTSNPTNPSSQPTRQPSSSPTTQPTAQPINPTSQPTNAPSCTPTVQPSSSPTSQPSTVPSNVPTSQPSSSPSSQPTSHPSSIPSLQPSSAPSCTPTVQPSSSPTSQPSSYPSSNPTGQPSSVPSSQPTSTPSGIPSAFPSSLPTVYPSTSPTIQPSASPSLAPSSFPTTQPSSSPSVAPSIAPTTTPTSLPTLYPTSTPSSIPTNSPSSSPSSLPSTSPSSVPSGQPSCSPSIGPTSQPSGAPTIQPLSSPTTLPSSQPTALPSSKPSVLPSVFPSCNPSSAPTGKPTAIPISSPTSLPSNNPSRNPSTQPTSSPTTSPSLSPTTVPTVCPSSSPTSFPSSSPTQIPTFAGFVRPSSRPSLLIDYFNGYFRVNPFNISLDGSDRGIKVALYPFGLLSTQSSAISPLNTPTTEIGRGYIIYGEKNWEKRLAGDRAINVSCDDSVLRPFAGISLDKSTRSISVAGDINSDGYTDIVLGDPLASKVCVFYGRQASLHQSYHYGFYVFGESSTDYLGWAVSGAGDFNGDGFEDIIVSAMVASRCYVLFGSPSRLTSLYLKDMQESEGVRLSLSASASEKGWNSLGVAVSAAGDVNGDGFDDVVMTAIGRSGRNAIFLVYGTNETLPLDLLSLVGGQSPAGFVIEAPTLSFAGLALAGVGDVNNDQLSDLAIGAIPYQQGQYDQRTYVVFGRNSSFSSSVGLFQDLLLENMTVSNGLVIEGAGFMVAGVGDVNYDGLDDFVVIRFTEWQGKSGCFVMTYPDPQTMTPTPGPTSLPSNQLSPSSRPTITSTPKPSRRPSAAPTESPSGPSRSPTISLTLPSNIPSALPTLGTKNPSFNPTRRPTTTPSPRPSRSPSFAPSPMPITSPPTTVAPTRVPTVSPTQCPTRSPSPVPSLSPTVAPNASFVEVSITSPGKYFGNNTNERYLIAPERENNQSTLYPLIAVTITGNQGRKEYVVTPTVNCTIIITDFNVNTSILDLSLFPSDYTLQYTTDPLTILLPDHQIVMFSSIIYFSLQSSNLKINTATATNTKSTSSSSTSAGSYVAVINATAVLGTLVLLTLIFFMHQKHTENVQMKKKKRSSFRRKSREEAAEEPSSDSDSGPPVERQAHADFSSRHYYRPQDRGNRQTKALVNHSHLEFVSPPRVEPDVDGTNWSDQRSESPPDRGSESLSPSKVELSQLTSPDASSTPAVSDSNRDYIPIHHVFPRPHSMRRRFTMSDLDEDDESFDSSEDYVQSRIITASHSSENPEGNDSLSSSDEQDEAAIETSDQRVCDVV